MYAWVGMMVDSLARSKVTFGRENAEEELVIK